MIYFSNIPADSSRNNCPTQQSSEGQACNTYVTKKSPQFYPLQLCICRQGIIQEKVYRVFDRNKLLLNIDYSQSLALAKEHSDHRSVKVYHGMKLYTVSVLKCDYAPYVITTCKKNGKRDLKRFW